MTQKAPDTAPVGRVVEESHRMFVAKAASFGDD
jgi:hypothetical protein